MRKLVFGIWDKKTKISLDTLRSVLLLFPARYIDLIRTQDTIATSFFLIDFQIGLYYLAFEVAPLILSYNIFDGIF